MSTRRTPTPDEVMVYLKVLDRFETPEYASAWRFFRQLGEQCPDYETFKTRCPLWNELYAQFDVVMCSYETAALLLKHQALNEDLVFEQLPRVIDVWHTAEPWVRGLRHDYRTGLFASVEQMAVRMEQWEREARVSVRMYDRLLVQEWLPLLPEVTAHLTEGVEVADVGCGQAKGLINLAQVFPASRYTGYDSGEPVITQARQAAEATGVTERVTFVHQPIAEALPAIYDVIMTFNVVHHAGHPVQFLRSIRQALRPGGIYLCLDGEKGRNEQIHYATAHIWRY